jgi:hypothetical protein
LDFGFWIDLVRRLSPGRRKKGVFEMEIQTPMVPELVEGLAHWRRIRISVLNPLIIEIFDKNL